MAQIAADPSAPGVVAYLEQRPSGLVLAHERLAHLLGVRTHGAKLDAGELLALTPDALLPEQDGPWGVQFDRQGDDAEER